jgi:hypothetical protein
MVIFITGYWCQYISLVAILLLGIGYSSIGAYYISGY